MYYLKEIKTLPQQFWIMNLIQLVEKLAWWVMLLQMPIYIAQKDVEGGLHWDQTVKALIYFWWALVQNITPLFAGGFADRYGYKKMLAISFVVIIAGYLFLGTQAEFYPFLFGTMILGFGMGIFRPAHLGVIAHTLNKQNASLGWAINLIVINLAGFLAIPVQIYLKEISWEAVFFGSAAIFACNFLILFLYKDTGFIKMETIRFENPFITFKKIIINIIKPKLSVFILLMSGFIMIYLQFYETLPNFIVDWVDTGELVRDLGLPDFMTRQTARGTMVAYEWLYNINTGLIIICVVFTSWMFSRFKRTIALFLGISIATLGFMLCGISSSGYILAGGFIVYTFGEMMTNPKFNEFMSMIAPKAEKGLYMGYLYISWAIGLCGGSLLGGWLYKIFGEKSSLAIKYLSEHYGITDGVVQTNAFNKLMLASGLDASSATDLLWNAYHPYYVWIPFIIIGFGSAIGMYFYSRKLSEL
jgi:MFS family permease